MRRSPINKRAPEIRFWEKVRPQPSGCWLWSARRNRKGYGEFGVSHGDVVLAHRYSFALCVGPIDEGQCVLHRCDVPACVNPDHLFLGTKADNNADMRAKNRGARGQSVRSARLDDQRALEIRLASGSHSDIAKRYGVHQTTVTRIKNERTWKHVEASA